MLGLKAMDSKVASLLALELSNDAEMTSGLLYCTLKTYPFNIIKTHLSAVSDLPTILPVTFKNNFAQS